VNQSLCTEIKVSALSKTWKETATVFSKLCKKLMDIQNCAAIEFAEMGLSTESID
jgi:hypothetical protein